MIYPIYMFVNRTLTTYIYVVEETVKKSERQSVYAHNSGVYRFIIPSHFTIDSTLLDINYINYFYKIRQNENQNLFATRTQTFYGT